MRSATWPPTIFKLIIHSFLFVGHPLSIHTGSRIHRAGESIQRTTAIDAKVGRFSVNVTYPRRPRIFGVACGQREKQTTSGRPVLGLFAIVTRKANATTTTTTFGHVPLLFVLDLPTATPTVVQHLCRCIGSPSHRQPSERRRFQQWRCSTVGNVARLSLSLSFTLLFHLEEPRKDDRLLWWW